MAAMEMTRVRGSCRSGRATGVAARMPAVATRRSIGSRQNVNTTGRGKLQVVCARVAGVEIPNKKRLETALTYIYGIGNTTAEAILRDTGIDNKRVYELDDQELATIRSEVEKYEVEGELRRKVQLDIKRLIDIQCYRGQRHQRRLPCRGQRTKTNARTKKGKAIPVAGKKKA